MPEQFICNWDGQYAEGQSVKIFKDKWLFCLEHYEEHGDEIRQMYARANFWEMLPTLIRMFS